MRIKAERNYIVEVSVLRGIDHNHAGSQQRFMQLGSREMG